MGESQNSKSDSQMVFGWLLLASPGAIQTGASVFIARQLFTCAQDGEGWQSTAVTSIHQIQQPNKARMPTAMSRTVPNQPRTNRAAASLDRSAENKHKNTL